MGVVLTSYFNSVPDPQRGIKWEADPKALQPLIDSLQGQKLILFTDCLDIKQENVEVVEVEGGDNPYYQRWFAYYNWLIVRPSEMVFCVDATDVLMVKNPFEYMDSEHIYVGDERELLGNDWMREKHPVIANFIGKSEHKLLNLGLLGGNANLIIPLLFDFKVLNMIYGDGLGQTDMAAFNLLLRTKYKDIVLHGDPINSQFKRFEVDRKDVFWMHK